jgi:hypothetical protein
VPVTGTQKVTGKGVVGSSPTFMTWRWPSTWAWVRGNRRMRGASLSAACTLARLELSTGTLPGRVAFVTPP